VTYLKQPPINKFQSHGDHHSQASL